jgi:enoyl-CoA hydratase
VLGGALVDAPTALELGIFDELAEPAAVIDAALAAARRLAELPAATYARVKSQLRGPALEQMREALEHDPLAAGWLSDETGAAAASVLDRD